MDEFLNRQIFLFAEKEYSLRTFRRQIETIAVGSSHGLFGFDPRIIKNSFNLCCSSQDLKYSYLLYRKASMLCEKLKHVVLFYSTFSPGWVLEKSKSESPIAVALAHSFHLNDGLPGFRNADVIDALAKARVFPDRFHVNKRFPPPDFCFFEDSYGVANRVSSHIRYNRIKFAIKYLLQILYLARDLKHRILLVLPPYRTDYRTQFDSAGGDRYSGLGSLQTVGDQTARTKVIDFYDDMEFAFNDFGDFDHLNPRGKGPSKLTRSIKSQFFEC